MNYMTLPVRRGSIWHDDHIPSSHNLIGGPKRGIVEEKEEEDDKKEEANRKKNIKDSGLARRIKHLILNKKYRDVDWFRININVGGVKYVTFKGTLKNNPETRLGKLTEESDEYDAINNEYFFDRNPHFFPYILDYQRRGRIHIPRSFCPRTVRDELKYWGLDDLGLYHCCRKHFFDGLNEVVAIESLENDLKGMPDTLYDVLSDNSNTQNSSTWKDKMWLFLDDSRSSIYSKIWSYVYMFLVMVSIASIFIGTLPSCRVQHSTIFKRRTELQPLTIKAIQKRWLSYHNDTNRIQPPASGASQFLKDTAEHNEKIEMLLTTQPHDALIVIDILCMIFFTVEFVIRFIVCPRKLRLLKRGSTIFDLLYLVPVWLLFFIDVIDSTFWNHSERITFLLLIQAFMVMRVFRIFRLMRHYRGLKILWLAIRSSIGELFLLYVFVLFFITIFASFIYCAEIFNNEAYDNILVGYWWALITMTTVGYGDIYPSTWAGRIVASICALTGIVIIGMPVPIIASNFHTYYGLQVTDDADVVVKRTTEEKVTPVDEIFKPETKSEVTTKILDDPNPPEEKTTVIGDKIEQAAEKNTEVIDVHGTNAAVHCRPFLPKVNVTPEDPGTSHVTQPHLNPIDIKSGKRAGATLHTVHSIQSESSVRRVSVGELQPKLNVVTSLTLPDA